MLKPSAEGGTHGATHLHYGAPLIYQVMGLCYFKTTEHREHFIECIAHFARVSRRKTKNKQIGIAENRIRGTTLLGGLGSSSPLLKSDRYGRGSTLRLDVLSRCSELAQPVKSFLCIHRNSHPSLLRGEHHWKCLSFVSSMLQWRCCLRALSPLGAIVEVPYQLLVHSLHSL